MTAVVDQMKYGLLISCAIVSKKVGLYVPLRAEMEGRFLLDLVSDVSLS